ncbi:MAG: flagellar biosynthesis protein FlhB [Hydrogenophilales bacterium 16-64-46]|nr:MAG: flagellar biosynthesis protein FlhB [Hydrogenophilales bacterium 12-64-13]OYZ04750.1 MAG: flagellar biosynthesis protein FlhB [Hydrogenophilales bacterium 16-64-46]OZA38435.1 MAG: flagellar biosynthesis protein FlhB [Hydrogenophilales bacterium 17-64-34]HQT01335.1 flagellar biosynthesis protein FlhB [Thiobacillus sp.]
MAEESDQERTEAPSPQRLEKAREEGQVPQSRELATFVVLMTGGAALWMTASQMGQSLSGIVKSGLAFEPAVARDSHYVFDKLSGQVFDASLALAPFLLLVIIATLTGPLLLRGWLFSSKALMPKFSRLSPLAGFKRMFSHQSVVELVKSIAKVGLLGSIATWLVWSNLDGAFSLGIESPEQAVAHMGDLVGRMFLLATGAMIFIVVLDVPYQLWSHLDKLKMTKEQLKQEAKENEGDPYLKARVRATQREMARRRMMAEIPTADVVVTNPTHYAVALKYSEGKMGAPRVVAKGADAVAAKIRELAAEHRVPLLEAPPLARALYRHTELGDEIPATLYAAVAEVLAYVFQLRHFQQVGGTYPNVPVDLPVPPELDPLQAPDAGVRA